MIAVIAAMGKEVAILKENARDVQEGVLCGAEYFTGNFSGTEAVVIKSGVGKAAAAAATALAIASFHAEAVINTGIAAGTFERGTVMLADKLVQHDFDMCADGLKAGEIPGFESAYFSADAALNAKLKAALEKGGVECKSCAIASGDVFLADRKRMKQITADFQADGIDMESGAVAQICTAAKVPFAVLRCVSDGGDNVEDYYDFAKKACEIFSSALLKFFSA